MMNIKKVLIVLIIITFNSCKLRESELIKGNWGIYGINYRGLDLINEKKTKSIVDLNFHVDFKLKKFLIVQSGNNINGDINLYKENTNVFIKIKNSNDDRYNNIYEVFLDTIPLNQQNNIMRLNLKSKRMRIKARKVIPNTNFEHDKNRKDGLKMYD